MSVSSRLTEVFKSAETLEFDDSSKIICFSDCHRGDNSWADDFAHNQTLFFYALRYYYEAGFTYIELGDGDELLENRSFTTIQQAHSHIYWLLHQFYVDHRFHLLFGNHNIQWKDPQNVEKYLNSYYDDRAHEWKPLFEGIKVHEGLKLRHADTGHQLFLVHGHQGDFMSDTAWRLGTFSVRHVWRHLQIVGLHDPTSPAQNFKKRGKVENDIIAWIQQHRQPTICGHTHRSMLHEPDPDLPPYFNTGSCVHPRCITGIEIMGGQILLTKWWLAPNPQGLIKVSREELAGPYLLRDYFENTP